MIQMPQNANRIIELLEQAGYEAYIVGGCVRDAILHKRPNDWDITTSAEPEEVKRIFRRTVDTGIEHGTVTVLMGKEAYEVTTYRIDGKYSDHRRPEQVAFTKSLKEDLLRRDFTINAMAYNDKVGLVDLYDGIGDLQRGIIRCVGEATKRFDEDALRILRAIRFAAQLDFVIEEQTKQAIIEQEAFLRDISAERIQVELTKLLTSDHPERLLEAYTLGITAIVLPEFDAMMQVEQNNPHHCYTVGEHAVKTVCAMENEPALRWAALLHDIGKTVTKQTGEDGIDHFYGHSREGIPLARAVLHRMKLDNATIKRVLRLVEWHDYGRGLDIRKNTLRKAIVKMGGIEAFPDVLAIRYADTMAQSDTYRQVNLEQIAYLRTLYEEILSEQDCLTIKDLKINGRDLQELGVSQGKQIGDILKALLEDVLDEPSHNERQYLEEQVKRFLN